jgi:hypothetical protein
MSGPPARSIHPATAAVTNPRKTDGRTNLGMVLSQCSASWRPGTCWKMSTSPWLLRRCSSAVSLALVKVGMGDGEGLSGVFRLCFAIDHH